MYNRTNKIIIFNNTYINDFKQILILFSKKKLGPINDPQLIIIIILLILFN